MASWLPPPGGWSHFFPSPVVSHFKSGILIDAAFGPPSATEIGHRIDDKAHDGIYHLMSNEFHPKLSQFWIIIISFGVDTSNH